MYKHVNVYMQPNWQPKVIHFVNIAPKQAPNSRTNESTNWHNEEFSGSCACTRPPAWPRGCLKWLANWLSGCLTECVISEWLCVYKAAVATATPWPSDWQSCFLPSLEKLSAVSTDHRRQLLIFYLSIIFVFHSETYVSKSCVCVYAVQISVFRCGSAVCMLPISLWRWKWEHTQHVYPVAFYVAVVSSWFPVNKHNNPSTPHTAH